MGGGVAGDAGVVDAQARADAFQLCFHAVGVDDNITANRGGTVTEHKDASRFGNSFRRWSEDGDFTGSEVGRCHPHPHTTLHGRNP